ncbi:uncharacterized protein UDID_18131 [Ustilago sp. UG-2017a]|nr:uncharacterized protein UDID_18131 [Ustilago sp. UG-2017a]
MAEAKDRFVLRAIELASSSGRGTTSVAMAQHQSATSTSTSTLLAADNNAPTSGSNWVVLESTPWTMSMAEAATKKVCTEGPAQNESAKQASGINDLIGLVAQITCKINQDRGF